MTQHIKTASGLIVPVDALTEAGIPDIIAGGDNSELQALTAANRKTLLCAQLVCERCDSVNLERLKKAMSEFRAACAVAALANETKKDTQPAAA